MSQHQIKALAVLAAIRAGFISQFLVTPMMHASCCRVLSVCPTTDMVHLFEVDRAYNWLQHECISAYTQQRITTCTQEIIKEYGLECAA